MKLIDAVKFSLIEYPTLYSSPSFESSKMRVYNQLFLVLGNGYEWAVSKKGFEGYMIEPKHYKYNGEWVRKNDLPYGRQKCDVSLERLFSEPIIKIRQRDRKEESRWSVIPELKMVYGDMYKVIWHGFINDMPLKFRKCIPSYASKVKSEDCFPYKDFFIEEEYSKLLDYGLDYEYDSDYVVDFTCREYEETPYPFSFNLWPFMDKHYSKEPPINVKLIKPDWREGMIECFEWAIKYYQTYKPNSCTTCNTEEELKKFMKNTNISVELNPEDTLEDRFAVVLQVYTIRDYNIRIAQLKEKITLLKEV